MDLLVSPEIWAAFLTLTLLEVVLGIDNVIFISILCNRLPPGQRTLARTLGLSAAMGTRLLLLLTLSWMMGLTQPVFDFLGRSVSGRDLILFFGGFFLVFKAVREIHNSLHLDEDIHHVGSTDVLWLVLLQIAVIDIVFSLDSVITAVGLVDDIPVMVAAIVVAVLVMMVAAGPISRFVDANPPIKMLALTFLVLIGFALVTESFGVHVPKGYIYFAMAFAFLVEILNLAASKKTRIKLRKAQLGDLMPVEEPSLST